MKHCRFIFIVFFIISVSFRPDFSKNTPLNKVTRVVIDPGHGGHDPGAVGKKSKEKDIVLDVALLAGKMIEEFCPDVEVFYTRKTDIFVELHRRAKIANDKNADLFISIHCNAAKRTEANGTEVFVMGLDKSNQNLEVAKKENASILLEENYKDYYEGINPNSAEAYIVFSLFQHAFLEQSLTLAAKTMNTFNTYVALTNRGVKQAPFFVLWRTTMPSILVEIGFISNVIEEEFMMKEENKKKIAYSIYKAFVQYKNAVEGENLKIADFSLATGIKLSDTIKKNDETAKTAENPCLTTTRRQENNLQNIEKELSTEVKSENIIFCVQLFIDTELLSSEDTRFKGIEGVYYYFDNGYYKYVVGNEKSFKAAAAIQKTMRESGFEDAFVVALQNGVRINIKLARDLTEQK